MTRRIQYWIPATRMWRSDLVSEIFVRLQLARARQTYRDTETDLRNLDEDIRNVQQEIKAKWSTATANVMRAFEQRLRGIGRERGHLMYVRKRLRESIDTMLEIGNKRGWKL